MILEVQECLSDFFSFFKHYRSVIKRFRLLASVFLLYKMMWNNFNLFKNKRLFLKYVFLKYNLVQKSTDFIFIV